MIDKMLASLRATIELGRHDFMRSSVRAALATRFGLVALDLALLPLFFV